MYNECFCYLMFVCAGVLKAPHPSERQRNIDLSTTVQRNLNENEFYQSHTQVGRGSVHNQSVYDSLSALEALASQNGFNFDPSVLGQASQQLAAINEKQKNTHLLARTSGQSHNQESMLNRTSERESKSKKRRKSSKSKSELDVEDNPGELTSMQVYNSQIVELDNMLKEQQGDIHSQCRSSRSSRKSVEDPYRTNVDAVDEMHTLAPMSAMYLHKEEPTHSNILPNRTEKPLTPEHNHLTSPNLKVSPSLKGLQLYVPKLVITKVKQRRGSKEVETHQVREVLPDSESEIHRSKKRRRSSDDMGRINSSHEWDEGINFFLFIHIC